MTKEYKQNQVRPAAGHEKAAATLVVRCRRLWFQLQMQIEGIQRAGKSNMQRQSVKDGSSAMISPQC
jgi:hypothetical protein